MDLLVYHDMTDYTGTRLQVGANAGQKFGNTFEGYYVVAVGPPIHDSKDITVVLAHGPRPMKEIQDLLNRNP